MTGRKKLLYLLRQPFAAEQGDSLLPPQTDSAWESDIKIVLLDDAIDTKPPIAGRTFILNEDSAKNDHHPDAQVISYRDLMQFIFEADSTIVI
jgi:hypothetical protein